MLPICSHQLVKPTDLSPYSHCSDRYPAPSVALTSLKCTKHVTDSGSIRGGCSINYVQFIKLHVSYYICLHIQHAHVYTVWPMYDTACVHKWWLIMIKLRDVCVHMCIWHFQSVCVWLLVTGITLKALSACNHWCAEHFEARLDGWTNGLEAWTDGLPTQHKWQTASSAARLETVANAGE